VPAVVTSFATSVAGGVLGANLTPHYPHHTIASWMMQNGADLWEVPGFLRTTPQRLQQELWASPPGLSPRRGEGRVEVAEPSRPESG